MIEAGAFGRIIEVNAGFLHSSDLDPRQTDQLETDDRVQRRIRLHGRPGHARLPRAVRAGWMPRNVRAVLSKIVAERPDGNGGMAPCETWDNATLLCEAPIRRRRLFPMTIKTQRIAPGEKNTWYLECSAPRPRRGSRPKNPKRLEVLEYTGGEQVWGRIDMGHETAFKSITGGIFEFGFSDAILQMWAAFLYELEHGRPARFAACVTPEETALSHRLFTAALESHARGPWWPCEFSRAMLEGAGNFQFVRENGTLTLFPPAEPATEPCRNHWT